MLTAILIVAALVLGSVMTALLTSNRGISDLTLDGVITGGAAKNQIVSSTGTGNTLVADENVTKTTRGNLTLDGGGTGAFVAGNVQNTSTALDSFRP